MSSQLLEILRSKAESRGLSITIDEGEVHTGPYGDKMIDVCLSYDKAIEVNVNDLTYDSLILLYYECD